ncbi:MAG: hypothetical protein IJS60_01110 [Abditibacteriota bacterium]|nr:hypothetical protein [Abditibacteriota bacterium]
MKVMFILALILICGGLFAQNVNYNTDPMSGRDIVTIDDCSKVADWTYISKGKLSVSDFTYYSKHSLLWEFTIDKYRNSVVGLVKNNINMPLPEQIYFQFYPNAHKDVHPGVLRQFKMYIGIEDSKGNRVVSFPYFNINDCQWNGISLKPKEMTPFAYGAKGIEDVKSIFIGTQEGAAEWVNGGKYSAYIGPINFVYSEGQYFPQKTHEEISALRETAEKKRDILKEKLDAQIAKGLTCKYELSALTCIDLFLGYNKSEEQEGHLNRAYTQLEDLIKIADENIARLDAIEQDLKNYVEYVSPNMNNIKIIDGVCYDGLRPVFLTGYNGWGGPNDFKIMRDLGFNYYAPEFPTYAYKEPEAIRGTKANFEALRENNLAVTILLSPHYAGGEAFEKYPDMDRNSARRIANVFMPFNVQSEGFREYMADYIATLVPAIKDFPNFIGYDLINEFWYDMLPDFSYESFVKVMGEHPKDPWTAESKFTKYNTEEFLKWYRAEVEKYDKDHIIFTKVIGFGEVLGGDRENISEILSANGMDQVNHWTDDDGEFAYNLWQQCINLDSYRSFDPNKIIQDGEYHVIPFGKPNFSKKKMEFVMWNNFVRGKDLNAIWVWGRDIENTANPFSAQPMAVYAAAKAHMDVNRVADKVVPFAKQKGEFAIFYGGSEMQKLYTAADFTGVNFDFITNKMIEKGKAKEYKFIAIMDDADVSKEAMEALKDVNVVKFKTSATGKSLFGSLKNSIDKYGCKSEIRFNKWGLESRSYSFDGKTYFYVMNYDRKPIDISFPKTAKDLLTGKEYDKIKVDSLDFYLFEM